MRSLRRAAAGAVLLLAASTNARAQQPAPGGEPPAPGSAQPAAEPAVAPETPAEESEESAEAAEPEAAAPGAATATRQGAEVAAAAPAVGGGAVDPLAPGWRERIHLVVYDGGSPGKPGSAPTLRVNDGGSPGKPGSAPKPPVGLIRLAPILLIQAQASPYAGEDSLHQAGDIAERPGFRLRRARMGLRGDVQEKVRFAVSAELGSEDAGALLVHDAWAGYTAMPYLQVFAGARDVAFSRSALTGAGDSALIERPLAVRAIAPFTQVGIQVEGHFADEAFSYYAGVYNGFQRSNQFFEGHAASYAPLGNRFEGVALAGRVATEPLGQLGRTIQDVAHSPLRIGVGGDYFFSRGGARTLHGAGGDVLLHVAGLHVLAELLWLRASPREEPTQPITQIEAISSMGVVGEAGYMIIARTLGVSARVEWIEPDPDADNEGDNLVTTAGVSYHAFDDLLKAQLEFTHREELFGLSLENDALTLQLQLSL